jgi:hypothetical protein
MMRRAVHEAFTVARGREAFGKRLIELPLVRRQLIKLILPAEEALSIALFTADCLDRADSGDAQSQALRRILTPLIKLRACREARKVAGDAMEMRGGNGYIEEWIEPRLLRETHLGSIWEGTTNIIALDVIRAAAKTHAHRALSERLQPMIAAGPPDLAAALGERLEGALRLVESSSTDRNSRTARAASSGLYHATAAALFLHEAAKTGYTIRIDLARLVITHKLGVRDPLAAPSADDEAAADRVIDALAAARTVVCS